ncbi:unnamed protein product [Clonostachys solani]|uniref:Putative gamma-glutamylcyclotransferase n=1 Tax=Clonostachys solani TaxID=160281 RepID=A0A9P0ER06_9HYPO|nr:unnamed protein product [Clonostachys solani]
MSGDFTAFFYGTLMAPEVFYSVCYGTSKPPQAYQAMHTFTPATLDGYCRHRVQFADYPGIVPEEGCSVRGVYATGLTDANMQKLDHFEGSEYKKVNVKVKLVKNEGGKEVEGEEKDAVVYVFLSAEDLDKVEWDFEHFRKEKMGMWAW